MIRTPQRMNQIQQDGQIIPLIQSYTVFSGISLSQSSHKDNEQHLFIQVFIGEFSIANVESCEIYYSTLRILWPFEICTKLIADQKLWFLIFSKMIWEWLQRCLPSSLFPKWFCWGFHYSKLSSKSKLLDRLIYLFLCPPLFCSKLTHSHKVRYPLYTLFQTYLQECNKFCKVIQYRY